MKKKTRAYAFTLFSFLLPILSYPIPSVPLALSFPIPLKNP